MTGTPEPPGPGAATRIGDALRGVRVTMAALQRVEGDPAPRSTQALIALLQDWHDRTESVAPTGPPCTESLDRIRALHAEVVPAVEAIAYDLVREADPKVGQALVILAVEIDRSMAEAERALTERVPAPTARTAGL